MSKKLLLIGPPGSGKGTQADKLGQAHGLPKIVMGDLVRQCLKSEPSTENPLGISIRSIIQVGKLVPDDLIIQMFKVHLDKNSDLFQGGFLLDGFPRTVEQAKALQSYGINLDFILELQVPDEVVVERLGGRRIHVSSGRTYHVVYNPPIKAGCDDLTGDPLIQREDDNEEIILARLQVYHTQTKAVLDWYKNLSSQQGNQPQHLRIDASLSIDEVSAQIRRLIFLDVRS